MAMYNVCMLVALMAVGCWIIISGQETEERVPRGLIVSRAYPYIAGQRNNQCTGNNNEIGSCHSRRQCRQGNGTTSGVCSFASGVCCVRVLGFNETSSLKRTELRRLATDTTTDYMYSIRAGNARICQLRIDIRTLDIAQPVQTALASGSMTECSAEFMTINNIRLCGFSKNQHIYMPLSQAYNPTVMIQAVLASDSSAGNWDILATQLECQPGRPTPTGSQTRTNSWSYTREDRPEEFDYDSNDLGRQSQSHPRSTMANDAFLVAPAGCTQYYPNVTGTVSSFNFDDPDVANHQYLPNLNYAICFNQPNNEQLRMTFDSFALSRRTTPAAGTVSDAIDDQCIWSGAVPTNANPQDYLHLERLTYQTTPNQFVGSFFCGSVLSGSTVTYNTAPYVMRMVSDNFVDGTTEQGFRFNYRLV